MFTSGSNVLIVGLGKSGLSAAAAAQKNGANVWVYDDNLEVGGERREASQFKIFTPNSELRTPNFDLVITSPGIRFNHPILKLAAENKWPVASEIEFAYNLLNPSFVIGITGTNGKTTVVELLDHIFRLSGKPYTVAGNIGQPLSSFEKVENPLILELSSFQLHFIDRFRANIGVILNVTEDHFDWHCCFGQYLGDKLKIFRNQKEDDIALLCGDDKALNQKSEITKGRILTFGVNNKADYHKSDGYLMAKGEKVISTDELLLKGNHNYANVLAAMACASEAGIEWKVIKEGCRSFNGLKHRLQFVAQKSGVDFYNDSKSTNPDSTHKAIEAFDDSIILILGGRNKGNNFSFLKNYINKRVKEIILFGEAASEIKEQISTGAITNTVEEALGEAFNRAKSGDTVVFSPGCASFDLHNNYAERGEAFIKAVEQLTY